MKLDWSKETRKTRLGAERNDAVSFTDGANGTQAVVCSTAGESPRTSDPLSTRIISLKGNLRNDKAVHVLEQESARCINPGRRRVVLNLEEADDVDTRLVAALVDIHRKARLSRVAWKLVVSSRLAAWITLYKLDQVLQPFLGLGGQR